MKKRYEINHEGFSLVELSVATAIFSLGLGSLSLMMLAAILGTAEAGHRTVATSQAESLAEMIAMSSDAYGHHVFPTGEPLPDCGGGGCPGQNVAAANLAQWLQTLHDELPGGDGMVCRDSTPEDGGPGNPSCDGAGPLVIKVFWQETRQKPSGEVEVQRVISRLPW